MLFGIKNSLKDQIIALVLFGAGSGFMCYALDFQPRLHAGLVFGLIGIALGGAVFCIIAALHLLSLRVAKKYYKDPFRVFIDSFNKRSYIELGGAAVVAACGEELFLRAFLFGSLSFSSLLLAFMANFIAVFLIYFKGRRQLIWTLIAAVEGTLYALLYFWLKSLFAIAMAHAIAELLFSLATRHPKFLELIKDKE